MTRYIVHIGYPKAASTWLQSTIFSGIDPKIKPLKSSIHSEGDYQKSGYSLFYDEKSSSEMPDKAKTLCPFVFDPVRARADLLDRTPDGVDVICLSNEVWAGHPFSGGVTAKEFAERIKQIVPEAKILIVIRNQIDFLLSAYSHYLVNSGGLCSLRKYMNSDFNLQIPSHLDEYYEFDYLVRHYIDIFGRNNVLVLPAELLFLHGVKDFINPIYKFIGLDGMSYPFDAAPKNERDYKHYYILRLFPLLNLLSSPTPANGMAGLNLLRVKRGLISLLALFVSEKAVFRRKEADKRIIECRIGNSITASNLRLKEFVDYDLKDLGYPMPD